MDNYSKKPLFNPFKQEKRLDSIVSNLYVLYGDLNGIRTREYSLERAVT